VDEFLAAFKAEIMRQLQCRSDIACEVRATAQIRAGKLTDFSRVEPAHIRPLTAKGA
jgi:hypothetical protein